MGSVSVNNYRLLAKAILTAPPMPPADKRYKQRVSTYIAVIAQALAFSEEDYASILNA